uniref:M28 family peptidase n=1 Tax=Ignisphaera aggregans TaxID=334771 RepID=A0A7C2V8M0_9CREN
MISLENGIEWIAARLSSTGESVAGTRKEIQTIELIRELLENHTDYIHLENVEVLSWDEELCAIYVDGTPYECSVHPPYRGDVNIDFSAKDVVFIRSFDDIERMCRSIEGKLVVVEGFGDPSYVTIYAYLLRRLDPRAIVFVDRYETRRRVVSEDDLLSRYKTLEPPAIPAIHVPNSVGRALKRGHRVQMALKTSLRPAHGFNVIAEINGRDCGMLYLTAHHDRWFNSITDDTLGVALLIELARSGILKTILRNSITLAFFTAEEGFSNPLTSFYWLVGSRKHVVENAHRLLDTISLVVNVDVIYRGRTMYATSNMLARGLLLDLGVDPSDIEHDSMLFDSFAFTMSGIPSITIHNYYDAINDGLYHSTLDSTMVIDHRGLSRAVNAVYRLLKGFSNLLSPAKLSAYIDLGEKMLAHELAQRRLPLELSLLLYNVLAKLKSCSDTETVSRFGPTLHRILTTTWVSKLIYKGIEVYERTSYLYCSEDGVVLPLGIELGDACYSHVLHNLESLAYILRC